MDAILRMMEQVHQITRDNNHKIKLMVWWVSLCLKVIKSQKRADFLSNLIQDEDNKPILNNKVSCKMNVKIFNVIWMNVKIFNVSKMLKIGNSNSLWKKEEIPNHIDSFISSTNKNHKEYIDSVNQVGTGYDSAVRTFYKSTLMKKRKML